MRTFLGLSSASSLSVLPRLQRANKTVKNRKAPFPTRPQRTRRRCGARHDAPAAPDAAGRLVSEHAGCGVRRQTGVGAAPRRASGRTGCQRRQPTAAASRAQCVTLTPARDFRTFSSPRESHMGVLSASAEWRAALFPRGTKPWNLCGTRGVYINKVRRARGSRGLT